MPTPAGYARSQIRLHWIVAGLIVFQIIFGEGIGSAFRTLLQSGVASYDLAALSHVVAGVLVLVFGLWRIALCLTRGAPAAPAGQPRALRILGHSVHGLLYLLMIVAPLVGLVAWFGANREAAELHEAAKPAFVLLVALHVLGALWHQFVRKDGLLLRMMRATD